MTCHQGRVLSEKLQQQSSVLAGLGNAIRTFTRLGRGGITYWFQKKPWLLLSRATAFRCADLNPLQEMCFPRVFPYTQNVPTQSECTLTTGMLWLLSADSTLGSTPSVGFGKYLRRQSRGWSLQNPGCYSFAPAECSKCRPTIT